jgi:Zn-dependent peptidase ImmA (M78 family)
MNSDKPKPVFISAARKRELAELAEAVAQEHCPVGKINPENIAQAKGITISFGSYGDAFDGMLEHLAGRFHIYCNLERVARRNSPRAQFTLGHELAHFYIDEHRNALSAGRAPAHPSRCEFESKNPVEQEADLFSSCLLMPAARFIKQGKKAPVGLPGILDLASQFGTSVTSTAIRYATLGLTPCVVIKWSDSRYSWKWLSSEALEARFRKTFESASALPQGSATARALAGEKPPPAGFFQTGSTTAAWFPSVSYGAFRDIILIEQAIQLGKFGVLTFLYPENGSFPTHF